MFILIKYGRGWMEKRRGDYCFPYSMYLAKPTLSEDDLGHENNNPIFHVLVFACKDSQLAFQLNI